MPAETSPHSNLFLAAILFPSYLAIGEGFFVLLKWRLPSEIRVHKASLRETNGVIRGQ